MHSVSREHYTNINDALKALENHHKTLSKEERVGEELALDNLRKNLALRIEKLKVVNAETEDSFLKDLERPPTKRTKKAKSPHPTAPTA